MGNWCCVMCISATLYILDDVLPTGAPTLLIGRMQSPQPIVLYTLKLSLGHRLLLCLGSKPNLLQERHQVPLVMPGIGVPHMLHCQLLYRESSNLGLPHSSAASAEAAGVCSPVASADLRKHHRQHHALLSLGPLIGKLQDKV